MPPTSAFIAPAHQHEADGDAADAHPRPAAGLERLAKRQQNNACRTDYVACAAVNAAAVCCAAGTDCQLDQAGHVACCPRGAMCTGTISVGSVTVTATATAAASGASSSAAPPSGTTTGGSTVVVIVSSGPSSPSSTAAAASSSSSTTANGFIVPASTTTAGVVLSTPGANPNNANNSNFIGFAPLATPFPDQQACSAGYSSCQAQYQRCTAVLGVSANPVTVVPGPGSVAGQGITVTPAPSAVTVCQSLSSQACRDLQLSNCISLPTKTGNAAAAMIPTPAAWAAPVYGVGVGLWLAGFRDLGAVLGAG
ncbi:MAG: hypothetical protein M1826_000916 [Phylliscum demangeonii]|nr:MAG: hypothetical protein M1826_000916 [Phylliscum demangeonii]